MVVVNLHRFPYGGKHVLIHFTFDCVSAKAVLMVSRREDQNQRRKEKAYFETWNCYGVLLCVDFLLHGVCYLGEHEA